MKVGKQNFKNETVEIEHEGRIFNCFMFQDENGDIYFHFQGKDYYFRDLTFDQMVL